MKTCSRCKKEHTEATKRCGVCKQRERQAEEEKQVLASQAGVKRCSACKREHNESTKSCAKCKQAARERGNQLRPTQEYRAYHRDYKRQWCKGKGKVYSKSIQLRRKYGIDVIEYERMCVQQNNLCAICDELPTKKTLCVDHNHTTGKVRELLCNGCNAALGHSKESIRVLRNMIAYIERHA